MNRSQSLSYESGAHRLRIRKDLKPFDIRREGVDSRPIYLMLPNAALMNEAHEVVRAVQ